MPDIARTPTWLHIAAIVALLGSLLAWWMMGTLTRGEVACVLMLSAANALIVMDRLQHRSRREKREEFSHGPENEQCD